MKISPNVQSEYADVLESLRRYYREDETGGLHYGCNDFPPFISTANGSVKGPLVDLMNAVAAELGTEAVPVPFTWDEFTERLAREEYATVAVPIMPIHSRTYDVLKMFELGCGAVFVSRTCGQYRLRKLRSYLSAIAEHFQQTANEQKTASREIRKENIKRAVLELGNSFIRGFAAGRQYFENLLLRHLGIPIMREMEGPSIIKDAISAADEGYICLIDLLTLRIIENHIGDTEFRRNYFYTFLLGKYIDVPAGLPFIDVGEGSIGNYLHLHLKYDINRCWSTLVDRLKKDPSVERLETDPPGRLNTPFPFKFVDPHQQVFLKSEGLINQILLSMFTDRGKRISLVETNKRESKQSVAKESLGLPHHQYPLRSAQVLAYDGSRMRIGCLEAEGQTFEDALAAIGLQLHCEFHRLRLIPPHERSASETTRWQELCELVDVEKYMQGSPQEEPILGRVETIQGFTATLLLLTEWPEETITFKLDDLPAVAAGMAPGDYFSARIIRSENHGFEWRSWTIRPPLREDEGVWDEFDDYTRTLSSDSEAPK